MKKYIIGIVTLAFILGAEAAKSSSLDGFYVRMDTGVSLSQDGNGDIPTDFGNAAIIGGGIGYRINRHFRADAMLGYHTGYNMGENKTLLSSPLAMNADISSTDFMTSLYCDIDKFSIFTPYIGGGMGFSSHSIDNFTGSWNSIPSSVNSSSQTSFAWQVSFGTAIELSSRLVLDVGYNYFNAGSLEFPAMTNGTTVKTMTSDLTANELRAGLRYSF